ncbi:MAG: S8 family serine peptidase [Verrucomicrobia bacterium]|nr:S8 family serine peptidase [Verrucomicrobiota bacterium]
MKQQKTLAKNPWQGGGDHRQNDPKDWKLAGKLADTDYFTTFFPVGWYYHGVRRYRSVFIVLGFCLTGLLGYWLARTAVPVGTPKATAATALGSAADNEAEREVKFRRGERAPVFRSDEEALAAGALPGQRALVFKDREALERFLAQAGDRVRILGRIDALNALHIGFLNPDELAGLLRGDEELSMIFPAYVPNPKPGTAQAGVVGVGADLLRVLGITGDNSNWGKGVLVAILDTGVSDHPAFKSMITSINLVPLPADLTDWNGHGTAVASLVIGTGELTPGVAPGAAILSVRIADDLGESNSMLIARGIVAAVDAGASIINISMGSYGDSVLIRNAIEYANKAGAVIVASAGNEGLDHLAYPAANQGVIAVGAVDADGTPLAFSNSGKSLAAAAPGFEVNAAWTGDQAVGFSGSSPSAGIMSAAIAAAMGSGGSIQRSALEASALVLSKLDDVGAPGTDVLSGGGMVDMGRVIDAGTPGIYDAAVASNYVIPPSAEVPYPQLQVTVQNRGTEMLLNAGVLVKTTAGSIPFNVTTLKPNAIQTFTIPLPLASWNSTAPLTFDSSVWLSGGKIDSNPFNNRRVESYVPASN